MITYANNGTHLSSGFTVLVASASGSVRGACAFGGRSTPTVGHRCVTPPSDAVGPACADLGTMATRYNKERGPRVEKTLHRIQEKARQEESQAHGENTEYSGGLKAQRPRIAKALTEAGERREGSCDQICGTSIKKQASS